MASIRPSLFGHAPISPYGWEILRPKLGKSKNRDFGPKNKKNVILAVWDPLRPQIPIIRRYRSMAKLGWTYLRDKICARYNLTPSVIDNSRADSKNSSFWKVLKMALQNGNLESLISPRYCRQRANILRVGCVGAHEGLYYVT